jgi:hypothetical protein
MGREKQGNGENHTVRNFIVFALHVILLGQLKHGESDGCEGNEKFIQNFSRKTSGEEIIWKT